MPLTELIFKINAILFISSPIGSRKVCTRYEKKYNVYPFKDFLETPAVNENPYR